MLTSRIWRSFARSPTPAMPAVEVERKFAFGPTTHQVLLEHGAEFVRTDKIHDMYFDTDKFEFALLDTWLRRRNSVWELKTAQVSQRGEPKATKRGGSSHVEGTGAKQEVSGSETPMQSRIEVEEEGDILAHLRGLCEKLPVGTLGSLTSSGTLTPFVNMVCERDTFRFETTTVVLDSVWYLPLDEAPGAKVEAVARKLPPDYTVGEVELVVDSVGGVDEAHAVINSTIARLGLDTSSAARGKVSYYLHRACPALFEQLVSRKLN